MATFDRFDICEAHYMFAMNWHGGQFSKIYEKFAQLNRMGFKMRPCNSSNPMVVLEENGQEIYYNLVKKYYPEELEGAMDEDLKEVELH